MTPLDIMLGHAVTAVPFYQGRQPRLSDFPIVNKSTIRENCAAFITEKTDDSYRRLAKFLLAVDGNRSAEIPYSPAITIDQTSGSSGVPFRIPKLNVERKILALSIWAHRRSVDPHVSPSNFHAWIHGEDTWAAKLNDEDRYIHVKRSQARWLHCTPSLLRRYTQAVIDDPSLKSKALQFVECTGQFLDIESKTQAERALSVSVLDHFACREVWTIAYAGRSGVMRSSDNTVVVELVDDVGNATPDGQPGRVVITSLVQKLLPFIRYDTGDKAQFETISGVRMLRLLDCSPAQMLLGGKAEINGNRFFKELLISVYKRIGYRRLDTIQIRQMRPNCFHLLASGLRPTEAAPFAAAIGSEIDASKMLNAKAEVIFAGAYTPEGVKLNLFTNRYYNSGTL